MIISADVETYKKDEEGNYKPILDATGEYFTIGCIYKETGKVKSFTDKEEMWEYIIDLGRKEIKRGKKLTVYMHNAKYDAYNFFDLHDKNLRWFSEDPFIAGYYFKVKRKFKDKDEFMRWRLYSEKNSLNYTIIKSEGEIEIEQNKEGIKFLDTMALFRMSLKRMGELIGHKKTEMPEEVGRKLTKKKLKEISKYCENDCKITLKGVEFLKRKLRRDGIKIRHLCTINQIAISYIINELRKGENKHILIPSKGGGLTEFTYKPRMKEEIHSAYRGGYVRVWKTGRINNVTSIDFNSLYPYSAIKMKFPDLRTERKIEFPLEIMGLKELLNKIGVSRAMVKNEKDNLGLLQIRTGKKSYIPLKGKSLIGTWTHTELEEAVKSGYKIISIEWSVIWDEGRNPFKDLFLKLYKKRKEADSEFDNYFYKMILNGCLGKFGQTRVNQEILIDSVDMIYEYLKRNYEILKGVEGKTDIMYVNKNSNKEYMKKYYAPIIPTLVNAYARVIMYKTYRKIPKGKLCYTDTDSCITIGDYRKMMKMGEDIGEFKVDKDIETGEKLINTKAIIWGTKAKAVGNNIALSGVFRSDLNIEDFRGGAIKSRKMLGIKNSRNEDVGKFIIESRDLKRQEKEFWKTEKVLEEQNIYIDNDINDISHFAKYLKGLEVSHIEEK